VLDSSGDMVGAAVGLGILEIEVFGSGTGVKAEESTKKIRTSTMNRLQVFDHSRMLVGDLASVRVHATSGLTGLDVAPDHRSHIALVIHEASIKVRSLIWVRG